MAGEKIGKGFVVKKQGRIVVGQENYNQGTTRRGIELQSDLYQKGALERELEPTEQAMRQLGFKATAKMSDKERLAFLSKERIQELSKLQQYNDPTAHFRMVREEVKQAAIDGKTKLQFPTGETAMKIEGLGRGLKWGFKNVGDNVRDLTIPDLEIGKEVFNFDNAAQKWIITDILGEGKFKAVPKEALEMYRLLSQEEAVQRIVKYHPSRIETFDISGEVDTNNPIYRFYEKDLGHYLKSKYNAQFITDDKGVSWWQLDIRPEMGRAPVEAFGAIPLMGALQENQERYNQSKSTIPFVPQEPLFINK